MLLPARPLSCSLRISTLRAAEWTGREVPTVSPGSSKAESKLCTKPLGPLGHGRG